MLHPRSIPSLLLPLVACIHLQANNIPPPFEGDLTDGVVALGAYEVIGTRAETTDTTTLKVPTRTLELPRSVSVIDASRIREQDFQNASDLLFWVPGLNSNGDSYHFYARGFRMLPNDWKIDGFVGRVVGGSYAPNLFGVEAVTLLKGPASLLYGATSSPGGQISLSIKKPRDVAATTLDTRIRTFAGGGSSLGENSGWEVELDSTGPVGKSGRLLYRFLASHENARIRPAFPDTNRFYRLSATYRLDAAGRTQLTPIIEWSREDRTTRGTTISPSSSLSTSDGRTDYTLADASPRTVNLSAGHRIDDNVTWGADFESRLGREAAAPRFQVSFRRHDRDMDNNAWNVQTATLQRILPGSATASLADGPGTSWTVLRRHTRARSEFENTSLDVNLSDDRAFLADWQNRILLGANARWQDSQAYTSSNGVDQSPINTFTGRALSPLIADASPVLPRGSLTRTHAWNAYLQNQTAWRQRLILTLSAGYTGDTTESITAAGVSGGKVRRESAVTPNAALVYLLNSKAAAYVSWSSSYNLPSATAEDALGRTGTFDPTEGGSAELGLKTEWLGDRLAVNATLFRTALDGVLVQSEANELNPNGQRFYRQLDTGRKSQGVELELTARPVQGWDTTLTYAFIDAYNRNADGSRGGRAEMTPRHAGSVFTRYAFAPQHRFAGWSLRLGVIWQGDRIGGSSAPSVTAPDPLRLRAFHRIDAGLGYRWRAWNVALTVENLTNRDTLIGGSTGLNLDRANPRAVALRNGVTW